MREILFRGKATNRIDGRAYRTSHKNGDWVYGLLTNIENYAGFSEITNTNGISGIEVDKNTVGQFTGLTDKNGKEIFEGDICCVCLDPEVCIGKVIWDSEIASYNIQFNNGKCVLPLDIFIAKNKVGDKVWVEVIGNIHENPELLEVTDNV